MIDRAAAIAPAIPQTATIPSRRIAGIVLFATAGLPGMLSVEMPAESVTPRLFLAIAALLLVAAGSVLFVSDGRSSAFSLRRIHLTPWWISFYALGFGILSIGWTAPFQVGSAAIISRIGVPRAVLAASIGLAALTVGFALGPPKWASRALSRWVSWSAPAGPWRLRMPSVIVMIYVAGLSARLAQIARGRYAYLSNAARELSNPSSLNQLLSVLEQLARYGLILAALDAVAINRSLRARVTFTAILVTEIASSLASGFKSQLGFTLLAVAVVYGAARGGVSRRAVVAGGMALLLLIPINLAYRAQINSAARAGSLSPMATLTNLPSLMAKTYTGKSVTDTFGGSTDFASERLREIDNLALIMQRTPSEIPYRSATELVVGPIAALIPRALWPNKPVISTGYAFSQEYYNLPRASYTASAVTVPGDLYRHGGWPILIVGMMIIGFVLKAIETTCSPYRDLRLCLFYGGLFLLMTNLESDVVSLVAGLLQSILILGVLTRLAFVRTEP